MYILKKYHENSKNSQLLYPEIRFKALDSSAILPSTNLTEEGKGNSGYDLYCIEDVIIPPKSSVEVKTGLQLAYITEGYWFRIEPRSGLGFKNSLQPHLGIIDQPYRGNLGVKMYNFSEVNYTFKKGDRCAQLVVYPLIQPKISWTDEIEETQRGSNGFGSTGK